MVWVRLLCHFLNVFVDIGLSCPRPCFERLVAKRRSRIRDHNRCRGQAQVYTVSALMWELQCGGIWEFKALRGKSWITLRRPQVLDLVRYFAAHEAHT